MNASSNLGVSERSKPALAAATQAMKNSEFEIAIEQLKSILADDPLNELVNGMLGSIYAEIGMPDRAIAAFQRTLQANASNPLARFQLGLVLLNTNQYRAAIDTFEPMLGDDEDFLAHFHSGLALISLRRHADARPLLMKAQQRMPATHPLYPHLQQLLAQTE